MLTACSGSERVRDAGGHSLVVLNDASVMVSLGACCAELAGWSRGAAGAVVCCCFVCMVQVLWACSSVALLCHRAVWQPDKQIARLFLQVRMWETNT